MPESLMNRLPKHIQAIQCETRETWLEERKKYICASEVAAVMGESPYHSPFSQYQVKMGMKDDPTVNSDFLEAGLRMEPVCAKWFEDATGYPTDDPGPYTLIVNPEYPWLAATLDRVTLLPEGPGILELKNPNAFKIKDWDDDVPLPFHFQSQAQMLCAGLKHGAVASIVGGCQFRYKFTEAYPDLQDMVLADTRAFYERIQHGEPPAADGHEATKRALAIMHPKDKREIVNGKEVLSTVVLPAEARDWIAEYDECAEKMKFQTERQDAIKNRVKALLGDASIGTIPGGGEWSWKHQGGNLKDIVEVSASEMVRLRELGIPFKVLHTPESRVLRKKAGK